MKHQKTLLALLILQLLVFSPVALSMAINSEAVQPLPILAFIAFQVGGNLPLIVALGFILHSFVRD